LIAIVLAVPKPDKKPGLEVKISMPTVIDFKFYRLDEKGHAKPKPDKPEPKRVENIKGNGASPIGSKGGNQQWGLPHCYSCSKYTNISGKI